MSESVTAKEGVVDVTCATTRWERVPPLRQKSLCPVWFPSGGCGFPFGCTPRSSVPHCAKACTTRCLQVSGELSYGGNSACYPPPEESVWGCTRGLRVGCLRGRGRCCLQRPRCCRAEGGNCVLCLRRHTYCCRIHWFLRPLPPQPTECASPRSH